MEDHSNDAVEMLEANVLELEVFNLVKAWGVSDETVMILVECGVNTYEKLKMMELSDINEVFNKRSLIGEKILFRYNLNKWRMENKYEPLLCSVSDRTFISSTSTQEWVNSPASTNSEFNVKEILEKTVDGKDIISKYFAVNSLSELDQTLIVRIIVHHCICKNMKFSKFNVNVANICSIPFL